MNQNIDDSRNDFGRKVAALSTLYPASRGSRFMQDAVNSALDAWHNASGNDAEEAWETYEILRHLLSEARRNGQF